MIGRALMALSFVQLLLFLAAAARRSYLAIAVPMGIGLGIVSGIAFWVGYTMATTDWDDPADFGVEPPPDLDAAEGAPPPEGVQP